MRLCTIAPAHIWHGSNVTYIVQSSNRQSPVFLLAFLIAVNSACANVFPSVFLLLYPLAIIVPSCTITHPIGTSSSYESSEPLYTDKDLKNKADVTSYNYTVLDMDKTDYGMDEDKTVGTEIFGRLNTKRYIKMKDANAADRMYAD